MVQNSVGMTDVSWYKNSVTSTYVFAYVQLVLPRQFFFHCVKKGRQEP